MSPGACKGGSQGLPMCRKGVLDYDYDSGDWCFKEVKTDAKY